MGRHGKAGAPCRDGVPGQAGVPCWGQGVVPGRGAQLVVDPPLTAARWPLSPARGSPGGDQPASLSLGCLSDVSPERVPEPDVIL